MGSGRVVGGTPGLDCTGGPVSEAVSSGTGERALNERAATADTSVTPTKAGP